jgi:hypothetical protein
MVLKPKEVFLWATKPLSLLGYRPVPRSTYIVGMIGGGATLLLTDALFVGELFYGLITHATQP